MTLFVVLLTVISFTRLIEMNTSRRHRNQLLSKGAPPARDPGFLGMALLHIGILGGSLVEAVVFNRSAPTWLALPAAFVVLGAMALRLWAIVSLGEHWNVRVVDSTLLGVVQRGPYRHIRHPNYLAVFLELAFLPLVQGAWLVALLGTGLHLLVLRQRIHFEEAVLMGSSNYQKKMAEKPRFVPHLSRVLKSTSSAGHS